MNINKDVSAYLRQASEEQLILLEELRQVIHKANPETTEAIKWGFPVFALNKDYAYFRFAKKHITLGFYNFEKIEDYHNLLEGTGSMLRHIKIRSMEDIDVALIQRWLKAIAQ